MQMTNKINNILIITFIFIDNFCFCFTLNISNFKNEKKMENLAILYSN